MKSSRQMRAAQAEPPAGSAWRIAWWALLAAIIVVPLANGVFTIPFTGRTLVHDPYDIVKVAAVRMAVAVAAVAWAWDAFRPGGRVRVWTGGALFLGLLAWMGVSTVMSVDRAVSIFGQYGRNEGLITWAAYGLLMFLTVQLATDTGPVLGICKAIGGVSVPLAIYGVMQAAGVEPFGVGAFDYAGRAFATAGNPEQLGNLLVITTPVAAMLALGETMPARRAGWWAVTVLSMTGLVLTFTRGAWLGLAVAAVAVVILAMRLRPSIHRTVDGAALAAAGAMAAIIAVVTRGSQDAVTDLVSRLLATFDFASGSVQTRVELWRAAVAATAERPVLGFGPDTFLQLFPAFRTSAYYENVPVGTLADSAHNLWLQLATTVGLIGVALFVATVAVPIVGAAKVLWAVDARAGRARLALAGIWAAALGYLVAVSVATTDAGTAFLFWICLGVLAAPAARDYVLPRRAVRTALLVPVLAVAGALLALVTTGVWADARFYEARRFAGPESLQAADDAVRLAPYEGEYRTTLARLYLAALTNTIIATRESGSELEPGMVAEFERNLGLLEEAKARSPWDYRNYSALVGAYNDGGRYVDARYYQAALDLSEEALDRFPNSPELHLLRGRVLAALDRTAEARQAFEAALDITPRYAEAATELERLTEGATP